MSKNDVQVKVNMKGISNLIKAFSQFGYVKIGILGSNASKVHQVKDEETGKNRNITNAEIGVVHEFGRKDNKKPHARSFLRFPIEFRSKWILNQMGIKKLQIEETLSKGSAKKFLEFLGLAAEGAITEGFETSGFGQWEKLDPKTIAKRTNQSDKPLNDTGELKGSVTSKAVLSAK